MWRFFLATSFSTSLAVLALGCASGQRPDREWVGADAALKHAKRHQAETVEPRLYRMAETYFLRGQEDYRQQYFDESRESFQLAERYAKQAMRKAYVFQGTQGLATTSTEGLSENEEPSALTREKKW